MFTAKTEKALKEMIIQDLQSRDGVIRLIIATSALSMGVNIADRSIKLIKFINLNMVQNI